MTEINHELDITKKKKDQVNQPLHGDFSDKSPELQKILVDEVGGQKTNLDKEAFLVTEETSLYNDIFTCCWQ